MKQVRVGLGLVLVILMGCGIAGAQGPKTITVGAAGADFATIQAGVPGENKVNS